MIYFSAFLNISLELKMHKKAVAGHKIDDSQIANLRTRFDQNLRIFLIRLREKRKSII